MSAFSELREEILSDSDFGESAFYRASSKDGEGTALVGRFSREEPGPMMTSGKESLVFHSGIFKVLRSHATLGGIDAPEVGHELKLAKTKGGSLEWGWFIETVRGGAAGGWDLKVVKRERTEVGGKRVER